MIPEIAWKLVPEEFPPATPRWVENSAAAADFDFKLARAYAWAMHLLSRLPTETASALLDDANVPDPSREFYIADISAGFIPYDERAEHPTETARAARLQRGGPSIAIGDGERYSFGVVIGIARSEGDREPGPLYRPTRFVDIGEFPVIVEPRDIVGHAPPNPAGATSSCYARPRRSKRFYGPPWSDGIIVARHVLSPVGYALGTSVSMTTGQAMAVADIDEHASTIDAAILDCGSISPYAAQLPLAQAVAPGSVLAVRAQQTPFSAQVLRINDHPAYFGNMISHRIFLDTAGRRGDSGALVQTPGSAYATRAAAGVYIGSTGGRTPEGMVQSMRQVVEYFDIELYD
jgi:hypothetical protein